MYAENSANIETKNSDMQKFAAFIGELFLNIHLNKLEQYVKDFVQAERPRWVSHSPSHF